VHARIGKAMRELATVAPMVQREHPFSAVVTMRGIIDSCSPHEPQISDSVGTPSRSRRASSMISASTTRRS
jgi:hypothetical protein